MNITYPTVCQKKDGRYFIDLYINTKRYRLFTAQRIGLDFKPNNYPIQQRKKKAELLAKLVYDHLIKKNRIVPVPKYIREILQKTNLDDNIFTGTPEPYNRDYFKTLFTRFKRCCPGIDKHITIYSFRYSGAIEIFKRTGSLTKLQRAMGHSSLQVSLTYLRGLEITELKEEDMPILESRKICNLRIQNLNS